VSHIKKFRLFLFPVSWIYGAIIWFRNTLFDVEILPSVSFDMPVISIGNITVGGTGKTPHTEYLIRLLSQKNQIAVLSRGYKRKTKGFLLAGTQSKVSEIGDEPLQMKRKFPDLVVAVDKNRRNGIQELMNKTTEPFIDVILMDDAFQHRYVNPSISILLVDYNRMLYDDSLLPAGNLREPTGQIKRAEIIIISKCPNTLKPIDIRILSKKTHLFPYQSLYYTTMQYGRIKALSPLAKAGKTPISQEETYLEEGENIKAISELSMDQIKNQKRPVLILAGIASPQSFIDYIKNYCPDAQSILFPDHHVFNKKDANKIGSSFEKIKSSGGLIITTEKDTMRILNNPFMEAFIHHIYYIELQVHFLEEKGASFDKKILDYVRINKRNERMVTKKNNK
jgi:tetraacyldisaccharide 4'-kinase